ncbi:MAG: hypothetical protein ACTHV7_04310, partial [Oleiphilaceae bacterium]
MLKRSQPTSHSSMRVSALLVLTIMTFGSAAQAQSNEATQVQTPSEIVDVEITPNTASGTANSSDESSSGLCEKPQQWLYAKTYEESDMASHGG